MSLPRISLITVTFNSARVLERCWSDKLPDHVEWVVVDNNSTDDSVQIAKSLGATTIKLGANVGFGAANNVGFESTSAGFVGFVNPDVRLDATDLAGLEAHSVRYGGLVAPQLLNLDCSEQPNGRGAPTIWAKARHRLDPSRSQYRLVTGNNQTRDVVWITGAAVFAQRTTFNQLHCWDTSFFLYNEDVDLGIRAQKGRIPVTICGSVRVLHEWARETKHFAIRPWLRELRSTVKLYHRYPFLLLPGARGRLHPQYLKISPDLRVCEHT